MNSNLSADQILEIERHLEEIDQELDVLDPANAIESQQIEFKKLILQYYISQLETSKIKTTLHIVR